MTQIKWTMMFSLSLETGHSLLYSGIFKARNIRKEIHTRYSRGKPDKSEVTYYFEDREEMFDNLEACIQSHYKEIGSKGGTARVLNIKSGVKHG